MRFTPVQLKQANPSDLRVAGAWAVTSDDPEGRVKLVAERTTGRLLGGHVLAARGGEVMGEIALAVRLGLPAEAIRHTLHAYPTFSEGVFWAAFDLAKPDVA